MDPADLSLVQKRLQQTLKKVERVKANLSAAQATLATKEAALRKIVTVDATAADDRAAAVTPAPNSTASLAAALKKLAQNCDCASPEKINALVTRGHNTQ